MIASAAELDAVTLDAYGTLLRLRDPVARLQALLPDYPSEDVARAFELEGAYYVAHSHEGRDAASLADLHARCTAVFNGELGSALSPEEFVGAFEYELLPGVLDALRRLRALGLALAVVANFDVTLHERLASLRLPVVTSADAGVAKPDRRIFDRALALLRVRADRALHVGDTPATDAAGAAAAGLHFAPAPLADAVASLA